MNGASVIEVSGLSAWDHKLTVMRLYFCLVLPLLRASGKDKAMKRIPKTPVEFDYDLWTTEDGKCMVRVKLTGEVTEVAREVMKILRAEEKKLRRSFTGDASEDGEDRVDTILSLDYVSYEGGEDMDPAWLEDKSRMEDEVVMDMMIKEFAQSLTPKQLDVFQRCLVGGLSLREYSREKGISNQAISDINKAVQKKFKKFYARYLANG